MKAFKDLVNGDIIYYYDHCKMKPRVVTDVKLETEEQRYNTWNGYEVKICKWIIISFANGDPIRVGATFDEYKYKAWGHSTQIFSCKEAAIEYMYAIKKKREMKIKKLQSQLDRNLDIMNKYDILEL